MLADPVAKFIHNLRHGVSVKKNKKGTIQSWPERPLHVQSLAGELLKTCAALMLCPQFWLATSVFVLALPPTTK